MESVRERFLFTDCDGLEKKIQKNNNSKKQKKGSIECNERVSFFYAQQRMNKSRSSAFHGLLFLLHTY